MTSPLMEYALKFGEGLCESLIEEGEFDNKDECMEEVSDVAAKQAVAWINGICGPLVKKGEFSSKEECIQASKSTTSQNLT